MIAASSAPKPRARRLVDDHDAAVFATDASSASSSSGRSERMSRTSHDASPASASAARSHTRHHRAVRHQRHVVALARDPRLAERDDVLALGHLAAGGAVDELRLEDHDRVGIADRRGQQPLRVGRRRRDRDLDAGRVHVVGLGRVVVQLGRAHAAAVRHPDRERELHPAAGAPPVAADVGDELVEARVAERVVLHLAHRPPARHAQADRGAEDARPRPAACRRSGPRRSGRAARRWRGTRRRRGPRPRPSPSRRRRAPARTCRRR